MSNSDKFEQDDAIVADDSVPQQPAGVLDGNDEELSIDKGINAPEDGNYESVKGNEISKDEFENDEFDGVKKENILGDGEERSTRSNTNFAKADEEADKLVEQVSDAQNDGTSRIA